VIDVSVLRLLLLTITGWLDRREREALAYLIEENRLLRRQVGGRRLRFTDDDRRRLAIRAQRLGRKALREVRDDRYAGHPAAMAPAAGGAQVDVNEEAKPPFWCSCGDPTTRAAHGRGKSEVGATREFRVPSRISGTRSGDRRSRAA
jgi:hypothetical protein